MKPSTARSGQIRRGGAVTNCQTIQLQFDPIRAGRKRIVRIVSGYRTILTAVKCTAANLQKNTTTHEQQEKKGKHQQRKQHPKKQTKNDP